LKIEEVLLVLVLGLEYGMHGFFHIDYAVIPCQSVSFAKGNGGEWRYVPAMGLEMRKSSSECCKGHCDEECQAEFVKHDPWIEYKGAIVTSDGVDTRDSLGEE